MLARSAQGFKPLSVPKANPLSRLLSGKTKFEDRHARIAKRGSKLFGNAVVPASAYQVENANKTMKRGLQDRIRLAIEPRYACEPLQRKEVSSRVT